ncbi:flavin-containing monooxygenase [Streptomyces sp. NPDC057837]|uniref:flavin-containing monooxygenase n=1 Tax=Streptomyces sp. NPDC057837 TaxID=3346260 RepID=UPI0036A44C98
MNVPVQSERSGHLAGDGAASAENHQVVIIGSGISGIGAAIRLQQSGVRDFVMLERGQDVGGTWRDNRYPGAACDVPGLLYAYSFTRVPTWSASLPSAEEIFGYLRRCVADHGLEDHLHFGSEVTEARWSDEESRWHVVAGGRQYSSRFLIVATGLFSKPKVPDLPGLDSFAGATFHTTEWDLSYDVTGKKVALIGTGASAVQCVPHFAASAQSLDVYQRTPAWVLPRMERRIRPFEWALYQRRPRLRRLVRAVAFHVRESWALCFSGLLHRVVASGVAALARLHLRCRIADRNLRRRLTPSYRLGCKRVLLSNDYYPALRRGNVSLVTDSIARFTPDGVVTEDGVDRPADILVFGTGFTVDRPPIARCIAGRGGKRLSDVWNQGMTAHHNITVPGFPNMFMLLGPNTGTGHTSATLVLEAQLGYILDCLDQMRRHNLSDVDVLPQVQQKFSERLHSRMRRTVWLSGGCSSWYLDARTGRNTTLWPGSVRDYRSEVRSFRLAEYRVRGDGSGVSPASSDGAGHGAGAGRVR